MVIISCYAFIYCMKTKKNTKNTNQREHFSSRLGFILISAGCAIGLGNVWKFPYEVGQYGGAAFLILYLFCVALIALPLMSLELSIGRASQKSNALAYDLLKPKGSHWHLFKWVSLGGQYILMFFYTTVCGWMLNYIFKEGTGVFENTNAETTTQVFNNMTSNTGEIVFWMILACVIGMAICAGGVQKGIEKITKVMMLFLLVIMILLAVFAILQPNASEGLKFYLMPDFSLIFTDVPTFIDVLYQAMALAFFTMSVGMGSMVIFGSYINKERTLFGEAITIGSLDVFVAIVAGLIIFPACFAFNVNPGSGPSLVFETLPNVFANMPFGSVLGTMFFIFLSFAALSTVIAVFENIVAFWMDLKNWSRIKSVVINLIIIVVGSLPCCLGYNIWNGIDIPIANINTIMDLEDFIISNNILPLGGIFFVMFCSLKQGWGWNKALKEINTGKGAKLPKWMQPWVTIAIPICIFLIFILGWMSAID